MGINFVAGAKLIQLAARLERKGDVMMLGRHRLRMPERFQTRLDGLLSRKIPGVTYGDLTQDDGYAERFFTGIGFDAVQSLDISDFEGAEVLHDLNRPIPDALKGSCDLVYDGGTTEHVFDVAQAMDNIANLLRPGGVYVACVPGNGFFAHGFYQFGPELVYGYWKHARGFDVLSCSLLPEWPKFKEVPMVDPAIKGRRLKTKGLVPEGRCYLYYEVAKGPNARPFSATLQTDYVAKWSEHDAAQARQDTGHQRLREAHKETVDADG